MIINNRIPYEYFITKGKAQSNIGSPGLPFETGSYDGALREAGIHNTNILVYTSIIPKGAKEISRKEGISRIRFGEVMECIKAESSGKKGKTLSAAIIVTSVKDPNGNYLGSLASEYSNTFDKKDKMTKDELVSHIEKSLLGSVSEMVKHRQYGNFIEKPQMYKDNYTDLGYIIHPGKDFIYDNLTVTENYGSVLVAICFVSYKIKTIHKTITKKKKVNKVKINKK